MFLTTVRAVLFDDGAQPSGKFDKEDFLEAIKPIKTEALT